MDGEEIMFIVKITFRDAGSLFLMDDTYRPRTQALFTKDKNQIDVFFKTKEAANRAAYLAEVAMYPDRPLKREVLEWNGLE